MVSFIYRGGTKKVAKDQAVTYLICHRSGHYKPTMTDVSKRQRKMKPQGSCKMGGYCTAGIKLLKNLETAEVKMEICHTHYGHPLDSDAIPHLRVNPTLRKIILGKFQEGMLYVMQKNLTIHSDTKLIFILRSCILGMSFPEVLAYIHHNPNGLEGLRLVDRRAVRNIYDSWRHPLRRSKKGQKDLDDVIASNTSSNQPNIREGEETEAVPMSTNSYSFTAPDSSNAFTLNIQNTENEDIEDSCLAPLITSHDEPNQCSSIHEQQNSIESEIKKSNTCLSRKTDPVWIKQSHISGSEIGFSEDKKRSSSIETKSKNRKHSAGHKNKKDTECK